MLWKFQVVSTLHKKLFSRAPVTCVFLGGSSNSDSVVFKNAGFGKIKDYSWKTTPLQKKKKIAMKVLGMCVPFIRRYFQEHQFLVLLKHRNIDSVIFRNAGFEEINNHSLRTTPFQKKIAMELLGMYLPYVKSYFWEHQ